MKKQYTKKQIQEAINYWKNVLKTMNENRTREGNVIHSDMVPGDNPSFVKLGKEISVIPVDSWKEDKLFPTEYVEQCQTMHDLKRIANKYNGHYMVIQFNDDENLPEVHAIPLQPKDLSWFDEEFGENSKW